MKFKYLFFIAIILFWSAAMIFGQPRNERPPFGGNNRPEWFERVDVNKNGKLELEEYQSAADAFFKQRDKNGNGILEQSELLPEPRPGFRPSPQEIPPFLFLERGEFNLSRNEFGERLGQRFKEIDRNGDGAIDFREIEQLRPSPNDQRRPPQSPMAEFLGLEMRFGDKLVKDAPFSAEIVIENTRRLFDGSTAVKQTKGAIYRDGEGRTRREQTLEDIGGFSIGEPQKLIFINDFAAKIHYFIDVNRKIVRRNPLPENRPPVQTMLPPNAKTESLGEKTLEGVKVEGTRTIVEIPVGQIGNDKPLQAVTERWFSPALQMVVFSRHVDPLAGEQVFRLVNIKLGEPSAELFTAPKDFKVEK